MKQFRRLVQMQFNKMCQTGHLFRVALTGREIWDLYLKSFPGDPTFRDPASSVHNCNTCNSFFRRYGNVVAIDSSNRIMTLFDINVEELDEEREEYELAVATLTETIKSAPIESIFVETTDIHNKMGYGKTGALYNLGVEKNYKLYSPEEAERFGVVRSGEQRVFEHLALTCPKEFIHTGHLSIEAIVGTANDNFKVLERGLREISTDTLELVLDLIDQGSLLDGDTHRSKVVKFLELKKLYEFQHPDERNNWVWLQSRTFGNTRFRNDLVGVLCVELSEGEDLNDACKKWNIRVDPRNYMKTTAPVTQRQKDEAIKFLVENEYETSFDREIAQLSDISAADILHINSRSSGIVASKFADIAVGSTQHKRAKFDGIAEVTISEFMSNILPKATGLQVYLENRHKDNLVTLTRPKVPGSKPAFKWSNNFSWTYSNNLAGKSQIKEAVKAAGGNIIADMRFSIMWNEDGRSIVDFDAHAKTPEGEIYYNSYKLPSKTSSGAYLDIDMIRPTQVGVENIVWPDASKIQSGTYLLFVHNFDRGKNSGFKAEIEILGTKFQYHVANEVKTNAIVATITWDANKKTYEIEHHLPVIEENTPMYGLPPNEFHKVNLVCKSPNHWGDNVGNLHYFFFIENCVPTESLRGFHVENLNNELLAQKRFLEIVSGMRKIEPKKGLSGLGFNATIHDDLIVKVEGSFKRTVKIIF